MTFKFKNSVDDLLLDQHLQDLTVLAVDDDQDTLQLVELIFSLQGAHVVTASSVVDALRLFSQTRPHILISDIAMPYQDGYALIENIRGLTPDQGNQVLAVALTAFADRGTQQNCLAAGYQVFVTKPFDPDELVRVCLELLTQNNQIQS